MLIAAAVCPHPPLLVPEVTGASDPAVRELRRLRTACGDAVAALLGPAPDLLVVVGGAGQTAEYPAAADPFLTVALVEAARELGVEHHLGITASVDTFYEGQERTASANPHLLRALQGITEEYRHLNILNYEMESGTLFKMAGVYGFAAACVCGVIAQRTAGENIVLEQKSTAVDHAIAVALRAADRVAH